MPNDREMSAGLRHQEFRTQFYKQVSLHLNKDRAIATKNEL
jgi:hypothetical protein